MKEILLLVTMWIVTICTYISYIPQIVKIIKTKKSEDLSITSWLLWSISSIADFTYSILLGRVELIIASGSELILILITFILCIYYEYKNNYYIESEQKFQDRIDKIKAKDGNHTILITALIDDRARRKENRKKKKYLK